MDYKTVKKFQDSLNNMRAKVIAAKGTKVEGLTPLPQHQAQQKSSHTQERESKV